MNAPGPAQLKDPGEEIAALIGTLHDTEQRLDRLTAGEIDTVADSQGRTFLLRRAQDELRVSEATKQGAILNALPAHIALLDPEGIIVSVNEAWRKFAGDNALQGPQYGIGCDYLEACDTASGTDSAEARLAADGIRSVLHGGVKTFSLEYTCHSPEVHRWFLMTVTPLSDNPRKGAVVMHLNITEQRARDEKLHRFRAAMDVSGDGIFLIDRASMRYLDVNQTLCDLTGRKPRDLIGRTPMEVFGPDRALLERDYDALIADDKTAASLIEADHHHLDGTLIPIETRRRALRTETGWVIVGTARNISDRRAAEDRIAYLNRVYATLSGINTLIVRARDRDELFVDACRIAVEQGGFVQAMVCMIDPNGGKIAPVASAGMSKDLLTRIKGLLESDITSPTTMVARAMRGKAAVVSNVSQLDPQALLRSHHGEAGVRSVVVLPLLVAGEAVGAIALYAGESEFFHSEEMKLLNELAGDIAFGIDHIEKQERLDYLAYYDALTGLANRSLFLERVGQHMRAAKGAGHGLALILIDLERFKNINDSLGRSAGDVLLKQVAEWMKSNLGEANLLARVGADHFAVVLPQVSAEGEVAKLIEKWMNAFLDHPFNLKDGVFRISAKVGVALFPDDGDEADSLFRNAEAALKKAKARGERYLFYKAKMNDEVAVRLTLENQLRQALEKEEFVLHYQPKINLASGQLTGAEALIRWNNPRTGLVPPGHFIPILEDTGLINEVGKWALRKAIGTYLHWRRAGLPAVRIAVNVSPLQLRDRGFVDEVRQVLGVDPHAAAGLELEITESLIMEDVKHSIASLQAIRAMGVKISIDDFGTGFSSLAYLAKLPVDTLKIDRSFVNDMTVGPEGLSLVSMIIHLAHSLKLTVVAEGVETEEQSRLLQLLACEEMQGFLFSRPVPAEDFEAKFLARPSPA